jgi:sortase A
VKHHRANSILSTLQSRKFREVVSDILITIGALVLVFYVWYVWLGDIVTGAKQDSAAAALSEEWEKEKAALPEFDRDLGSSEGALRPRKPPVVSGAMGQAFATLIVPRFGKNYERTVAESVDVKKVLNDPSTGVGHYSSTARLGEVGNFALAGHRTTFGAPFGEVDRLRVGDRLYLETKEGWFVYRFRNIEYVNPSQSDVLNDMPRETVEAKDRILTMTSCHPKLSAAERIIAYSIYESFVPRKNGVPSEIMDMRNR